MSAGGGKRHDPKAEGGLDMLKPERREQIVQKPFWRWLIGSRWARRTLGGLAAVTIVLSAPVTPTSAGNGSGSGSLADPAAAENLLSDQPPSVTSTCFWGV